MPLNLSLEVDTFDTEEHFSKRLCSHDVELPLGGELGAVGDDGSWDGSGGRERGEKDNEGKGVVEVSEGIRESWVP